MVAEGGSDILAGQRLVHERRDVPGAIAGVVPAALELDGPDGLPGGQLVDRVDQPDLAAAAGLEALEDPEDLGLEGVPVHRGEIAGGGPRCGLLDHPGDADGTALGRAGPAPEDPVAGPGAGI